MARALLAGLSGVKAWVFRNQSRMAQITNGQGVPGTRAAPTQSGTNDKAIGCRLDNGETFEKDGRWYKRFNFQVNKGADNKTLKDLAKEDSHKVWAHADLDLEASDKNAALVQLFDDLATCLTE